MSDITLIRVVRLGRDRGYVKHMDFRRRKAYHKAYVVVGAPMGQEEHMHDAAAGRAVSDVLRAIREARGPQQQ